VKKKQPREYKVSILLNESEQRALDRFCDQYGVSNRSRLIRETLMRAILKQMENDQPTLFD
jgi:metal-responsive CopG/Arc/MetJ family transcriptional regulator